MSRGLERTLGYPPPQWLLLNQAHTKRNLADNEGDLADTVSVVDVIAYAALQLTAAQAIESLP
ncbi:MAG: hypothetical protein NVSMB6_27480 [Burkholderiaceae bacterium]